MKPIPMSVVDSEESVFQDGSTAPTTPEGSLSFSPVLPPARGADGVDDDTIGSLDARTRNLGRSISSSLLDSNILAGLVRNICCVGAGYVGTCQRHLLPFSPWPKVPLTSGRRSNRLRHGFPEPSHPSDRRRQGRGENPAVELETPSDLRTRPARHCPDRPRRLS